MIFGPQDYYTIKQYCCINLMFDYLFKYAQKICAMTHTIPLYLFYNWLRSFLLLDSSEPVYSRFRIFAGNIYVGENNFLPILRNYSYDLLVDNFSFLPICTYYIFPYLCLYFESWAYHKILHFIIWLSCVLLLLPKNSC